MTEPCDNCGCGMDGDDVETEEIDLDIGMDFSVMVRRHLENHTKVDEDDRIQKVTICPEEITAYIEVEPDDSGA